MVRWLAVLSVTVTGCLLALDFDGFDPAQPGGSGDASTSASGSLQLRVEPSRLALFPGESAVFEVLVERQGDARSTVALTGRTDGPIETNAGSILIAPDATRAQVTVTAATSAAPGLTSALFLVGSSGASRAEVSVTIEVRGRPGTLDATFGDGGVALLDLGDPAVLRDLHVTDDDRLLVGGSLTASAAMYVARATPSGAADVAFGSSGVTKLALPWGIDATQSGLLAVGADGSLVVASAPGTPISVVKLRPDGARDGAFGDAGSALVPANISPDALVRRPTGEIVLGGSRASRALLLQLSPAGAIDSSFGDGGSADYGGSPLPSRVAGADLASDGTIAGAIVFGDARVFRGFAVDVRGRALPPNTLPGPEGSVWDHTVRQVLRASTGDVVVVGGRSEYLAFEGVYQGIVAYRSTDGGVSARHPDDLTLPDPAGVQLHSAAFDADGGLVVAGALGAGRIVLYRLLADGRLDPTLPQEPAFPRRLPVGSAIRLVLQRSGRIVLGMSVLTPKRSVLLARFWP